MQFKFFTALALVCMTTLVSAAPIAVAVPPAAVVELARDINVEVARDPSPEPNPMCTRYSCQ